MNLDEVVAAIPAGDRVLVAIAGAPGAGKSTIAAQVVDRLDSAALLPMDGFHLPQERLVELGRRERMGAPDTFDVDGFLRVLSELRAGHDVLAPGFDRGVEETVPDQIEIPRKARTVVVEGNYLLFGSGGWEKARPFFDATFFVQVDRGIRQQRLIDRHIRYGKSPEAARAWSLGPDERNALLIEATAAGADHLIELS